jgi:hypothetical protein
MPRDHRGAVQSVFGGADDWMSRDECRKRALEYFLAAEEASDQDKREALHEGGRKWFDLASRIQGTPVTSPTRRDARR